MDSIALVLTLALFIVLYFWFADEMPAWSPVRPQKRLPRDWVRNQKRMKWTRIAIVVNAVVLVLSIFS